jgi:hypothetical protein
MGTQTQNQQVDGPAANMTTAVKEGGSWYQHPIHVM